MGRFKFVTLYYVLPETLRRRYREVGKENPKRRNTPIEVDVTR